MKTVLTAEHEAVAVLDGVKKTIKLEKGTVVDDLKEISTGHFTALVPDFGRRMKFVGTNEMFMEVEGEK